MTLGADYAGRLDQLAKGVRALGIDRRDPGKFLEDKDSLAQEAEGLARALELDQVFSGRSALGAMTPTFDATPRTIYDRKGRPVRVEPRGRRRS